MQLRLAAAAVTRSSVRVTQPSPKLYHFEGQAICSESELCECTASISCFSLTSVRVDAADVTANKTTAAAATRQQLSFFAQATSSRLHAETMLASTRCSTTNLFNGPLCWRS